MGNKQFKKIRKVLGTSSTTNDTSKQYQFITTPKLTLFGVKYMFTYISSGSKAMYKMGKIIYKETGILPHETLE